MSVGEAVYYNYDNENRLIQLANGTDTFQYTYDGDGNRESQTVTGSVYGTYQYIYDINAGLPRLVMEKDGEGNATDYLYAGRLYSLVNPEGQYYFHADGLGSISVVSDVYGNPVNQYEYDAFGNPLVAEETIHNPFRFTGEPYDASGLTYLRARYYDPSVGRFLSQDSLFGELNDPLSQNLYAYCGNNPVLYVDPSGHIQICFGQKAGFRFENHAMAEAADYGTTETPLRSISWDEDPISQGILMFTGIGEIKAAGNIKNIYTAIKNAPNFPKGFKAVQNGLKKVNVKNSKLLEELREIDPGTWKKVYKDGYDASGKKISIHYFESPSGKVFDVEVKSGWSNSQ